MPFLILLPGLAFVLTNTIPAAYNFQEYVCKHKAFVCLDQVYLISNQPVANKKANAMSSCTAILHIVCRAAHSSSFVFNAVKGLTSNHRNVTLVQAKKFMKLDKVSYFTCISICMHILIFL